jgi:hypothetical protein
MPAGVTAWHRDRLRMRSRMAKSASGWSEASVTLLMGRGGGQLRSLPVPEGRAWGRVSAWRTK